MQLQLVLVFQTLIILYMKIAMRINLSTCSHILETDYDSLQTCQEWLHPASNQYPSRFCDRLFNLDLPATILFDYPTPQALASLLAAELSTVDSTSLAPIPAGLCQQEDLQAKQVMVIDSIVPRFSSEHPAATGDGFSLDVVPYSRWDVDTSKASQRLGTRFARSKFSPRSTGP